MTPLVDKMFSMQMDSTKKLKAVKKTLMFDEAINVAVQESLTT